ncbi:MAG: hypothetical protein K1X89_01900 [Myxococcaceae bacterium]|nr:hypothetical protein [Myxococcaceae bacterium]
MRLVDDGPLRDHLKEGLHLLLPYRVELGPPQGLVLTLRIECECTTFVAFASDPENLSFLAFRRDASSATPAEEPPRLYGFGLDGDVLTVADALDVMEASRGGPESALHTDVVMGIHLDAKVVDADGDHEVSTDANAAIESFFDQLRTTAPTDWKLAEFGTGKSASSSAALMALNDYFRRGGKPS